MHEIIGNLMKSPYSPGNGTITKLLVKDCFEDSRALGDPWPIHIAAENGQMQIIKMLVDQGADFSQNDTNGASPLLLAAKNGR